MGSGIGQSEVGLSMHVLFTKRIESVIAGSKALIQETEPWFACKSVMPVAIMLHGARCVM
ncbi:hypothetical protein SDC9_125010 [bioreactor metagenome]|uniref:Uncharacterized protein n=1 Tax=bioreactor metagenome TaxID=1076179 RepID=A0A645CLS3_9ZZZZ